MFFLEQNCCECFQMDYLQTLKWSWVECINGAFNLATALPLMVNILSKTNTKQIKTQIHIQTQIEKIKNTNIGAG